jgi:uncharacterized protein YuzE
MPFNDESLFGTNEDGTKNNEYCYFCFKDGKFTSDITMEQMIEICVPHMKIMGIEEEEARKMLSEQFPTLKRWAS